MQAEFWHNRWRNMDIGWHRSRVHDQLEQWGKTALPEKGTILVPLCGKSLDLIWLLEHGYHVVGVELNREAVELFFAEHDVTPTIAQSGQFTIFQAPQIEIWVGDFFALEPAMLPHFDGWYDRAAMVALPSEADDSEMRSRYQQQLIRLLPVGAKGLLITIEYEPGFRQGPPFSIEKDEVLSRWKDAGEVTDLGPTTRQCEHPYAVVRC